MINKGDIIPWNEACAKGKDLYGHVQWDANQHDEESKHGKLIGKAILGLI